MKCFIKLFQYSFTFNLSKRGDDFRLPNKISSTVSTCCEGLCSCTLIRTRLGILFARHLYTKSCFMSGKHLSDNIIFSKLGMIVIIVNHCALQTLQTIMAI